MTESGWKANIAIAFFLIACMIPAVGMFLLPAPTPAANQRLSPLPRVWMPDGSFNQNILREITDYTADHIAFRQEMITARAALNAKLFHVSSEDSVILGRDDWLFYRETLDDFLHINPISERKLYGAAHTLALLAEYCETRGAEFYLTVAPNKASLYGEKLLTPGKPLYGQDNLDRLIPWLKSEGVNYIDLYSAFRNAYRERGEILYYHTDSHWNTRGAALAHDVLLSAMRDHYIIPEKDLFFPGAYHDGEPHRGDLYQMVYPAGNYQEPDIEFDRKFEFKYISDFRSPEDQLIETESPGKSGNLLMFRDSFGNSLHQFMADSYGKARFSRAMPVRMSLLDDNPEGDDNLNNNINHRADTVLLEIVERNLKYLSDRIPAFPAPRRILDDLNLDQPDNLYHNAPVINLTRADDGAFPDLIRLSGNLADHLEADFTPDVSSPVYAQIGKSGNNIDAVYEACLTGRDENAFALYIPEPPEDADLFVLYYNHAGILRRVPAVIAER